MKTPRIPGRKSYSSSGAVNWTSFIPLILLTLVVSAVLAVFMHLLFRWGHYYIFVVPAVCALPVAGMNILTMRTGHCRNPLIGAVVGCLAGVALYLGYYYAGMVDQLGVEHAGEIRLLPHYIRWRKEVEITSDLHSPGRDDRPMERDAGRTVLNWLLFCGELVCVLAITTGAALHRARKPYCEGCKRWMTRELTRFSPEKGQALVEALQASSPHSLAAIFATPEHPSLPNTTVAVDYCPSLKDAVLRSCPPYLSIKTITANPQGAALDAFEKARGTLLARSVQLGPDELPALLPRFATFQALTGHTAASALQQLGVRPEPPGEKPSVVADIRPLPTEFSGKILTRRTALISTGFALGALAAMFAGLGLLVWGGTMAYPDKSSPQRDVSPVEKAIGTALLAAGGLVFLSVGATFFIDPSWLSNRYLRNLVRKEFARRPAHLVNPDDAAATFVEVVPKLNWGKMKLESASDVGFLLLDKTRRELLFEGDKECYRIPATAITSCKVEVFVEGKGSHAATRFFYVVLQAHHPGGFWEAPIRRRGGTGMFLSRKRKRWAEGLCREILQLRGEGA